MIAYFILLWVIHSPGSRVGTKSECVFGVCQDLLFREQAKTLLSPAETSSFEFS